MCNEQQDLVQKISCPSAITSSHYEAPIIVPVLSSLKLKRRQACTDNRTIVVTELTRDGMFNKGLK